MSGLLVFGAIILGITVLGVIFSVGLLIDQQERVIADLRAKLAAVNHSDKKEGGTP